MANRIKNKIKAISSSAHIFSHCDPITPNIKPGTLCYACPQELETDHLPITFGGESWEGFFWCRFVEYIRDDDLYLVEDDLAKDRRPEDECLFLLRADEVRVIQNQY